MDYNVRPARHFGVSQFLLFVHAVWVATIVGLVPCIIIGSILGWIWVHNSIIRFFHIGMIGLVVAEVVFQFPCPLTALESKVRQNAGGNGYNEGFVIHWWKRFFRKAPPPKWFDAFYVVFFSFVVGLLWWVPIN